MKPGERITIFVNQGSRDATVLAVLGGEAIIEYVMPRGTTALRIIPVGSGLSRRASYWDVPLKWLRAIVEQGSSWEGRPQQSGHRRVPTAEDRLAIKERLRKARTLTGKLLVATHQDGP